MTTLNSTSTESSDNYSKGVAFKENVGCLSQIIESIDDNNLDEKGCEVSEDQGLNDTVDVNSTQKCVHDKLPKSLKKKEDDTKANHPSLNDEVSSYDVEDAHAVADTARRLLKEKALLKAHGENSESNSHNNEAGHLYSHESDPSLTEHWDDKGDNPFMTESITPFFEFSASTWSTFAHNKDKVNLTEEDLERCLAFNDKISLEDVKNIYMPLSRLLYLYVRSRHDRSTVIQQFLGKSIESAPFIISISGSVACGKTTTANLLKHLISSWDTNPKVELITTDGFLYPNKILRERHIEAKKGFPISYDVKALMTFLHQLKNGEPNLKVPVYSHLYYDVVPDEYIVVDRPDILILEGINVLQNGADYPMVRNKVFISDFIDFSIYVDADEECLIKWYLERFLKLRESTFNNPQSYFHRYAKMATEDAVEIAHTIWSAVNHENLVANILPSRNRANLILHKGPNHSVDHIYLRK